MKWHMLWKGNAKRRNELVENGSYISSRYEYNLINEKMREMKFRSFSNQDVTDRTCSIHLLPSEKNDNDTILQAR